ncbi:hypothetical protein QR46_4990 [Giardia duodenalis assemblage B]|uniref:Uncharacterized protein n=1 Tax=Giardia duodenalis assemblage B TaxID=1394984 RepID=A0A132NLX0_GIAIN|nr:hypothetical protein QR46_4990 [Giardia intestinalis assemblage B]
MCGAMGVLEGVGGGLWGGELPHTGEVGLQHAIRARMGTS